MQRQCAATPGFVGSDHVDIKFCKHPLRRCIDLGRHRWLHAALQHQHRTIALTFRPQAHRSLFKNMACQALWQGRADDLAKTKQHRKPGAQQKSHQQPSLQPFKTGTLKQCLDFGSRQLNQTPIVHPRRTSRLAGSAGKASIQVESRGLGSLSAFKQLLNEIDASARPVQLVSEQLIGWAGRCAKTAMNAFAEYLARLLAKRGAFEILSQFNVHR